ncbi:glycosyltransferase family 4 protein [Agromyces sp. NPDC058126]|uniref:glycosyltransferase family 4 protein n=1 Tax=Agromyces sp. NPDC058126 TaxID=3346350 RepID=UPI0036DB367B
MRVLVVTTWFPGPWAPESGIFNLRDVELLALDHEVTVVHLVPPAQLAQARVDRLGRIAVHRVPMSVRSPRSIRRARRYIAELALEHDLLHSMAISSLLPLGGTALKLPWVHTEHWSGFLAPETAPVGVRAMGALLARRLKRPDVVVTVSEALASAVRLHRDGPTMVIPNHVMVPPVGADLEREQTDHIRLIAVGGIIQRKGPILAVRVLAGLRARGYPATLSWIGEGPLRDDVMSTAARLGVADRIELRGSLSPEEVSRSLLGADVFLLPTEGETFGVSIAEALTHGLSVVVGSRGGQGEFVGPADGVLVAAQDQELYTDAVIAVVGSRTPATPAEIARRAQQRFAPAFRRTEYLRAYHLAGDPEGHSA